MLKNLTSTTGEHLQSTLLLMWGNAWIRTRPLSTMPIESGKYGGRVVENDEGPQRPGDFRHSAQGTYV